jgi:PAS domain S-box-containing protein
MEEVQPRDRQGALSRGGFLRERLTAAAPAALAAAVACAAVLLSAHWALRSKLHALEQTRAKQVRNVAEVLSHSAEGLLSSGELTRLRRAVVEAARGPSISQCRVVLPDGGVVADGDPSQITVTELPAAWDGEGGGSEWEQYDGSLYLAQALTVGGRGKARLEVVASLRQASDGAWAVRTAAAAFAAVALAAPLALWLWLRRRQRATQYVRHALLAFGQGLRTRGALKVDASLGEEAVSWNQLLAEKEATEERVALDHARDGLERRRGDSGDLEGVCDAMPQGLILVGNDLEVRYANGAAAVLLQTKRDQMIGRQVGELIRQEEVIRAVKAITEGEARQRRSSLEVERRDDGELEVLRFQVRPVRKEDRAAAMIAIEDVTQHRVAEETRRAFVTQATHELRAPLTNIRLYVESAIDEGSNDPSCLKKSLNVINQEARRLERVVGDMLSVSEIEAGSIKIRKDDIPMATIFEQIQADYQPQAAEKQLRLEFSLPPKLPVIQGDRDKILLALHNLISNAIKYTPPDGTVRVNVDVEDHQVVVEVADTGIGIGEEDIDFIFEKFYRSKDKRVQAVTGSGLGLALAREVVRCHGGDITVRSEPSKGSTFALRLPVVEAA